MKGGSSGQENSNLYVRGVHERRRGEHPDPSALIELLDVFGEDGLRPYLMGLAEDREGVPVEQVCLIPGGGAACPHAIV
jgi:hypothetical protein